MKKRIVSLLLALCVFCMCGLLASCNQLSTFVVVSQALEKTAKLDSMEAKMEMEMEMSMMGMDITVPIDAEVKAKGLQGDNPVSLSDISTSVLGQTVEMVMYQEGDWAYYVVDDMKYKTNIAEAEAETDYTGVVTGLLQKLPEGLLEGIELVDNEDGSQTMSLELSGEQFTEIYADILDTTSAQYGDSISKFEISDASISITVKDGYVSVFDMAFTMDMTVEGVETSSDVVYKVSYLNPGQEVTITPPEGYQDFEEMDLTA